MFACCKQTFSSPRVPQITGFSVVYIHWMEQFYQQCMGNLLKKFFPFFGADHNFAIIFIFFFLLFIFFQASKHLCNSSTCAREKFFNIYLWHFSDRGGHTGFMTFRIVLQSQKGAGHLGFWGMIGNQVIKIDMFSARSYCNTEYLVVFTLFTLYYL